ncbi:MAG: PBP1A family penicillin-binding protein [Actinobacteria bacterium]|nr:PBP1A family penicillin-binding protein [Actinomycetota bacterium]
MSIARNKNKKIRKKRAKIIKILGFFLFITSIFVIFSLIFSIYVIGKISTDLPHIDELTPREQPLTTEIYASDGSLLAYLHAEEDRKIVPLNEISRYVINATIAREDERFYEHPGFDIEAIIRALLMNIIEGKIVEGGSTITQSYIGCSYISLERTYLNKLKEAYLAYQLEQRFSKDEILELFLNTVYYGEGSYGIETAAKNYFGKSAKDLNLNEAAFLAGVTRNPGGYSPYTNYREALERRNSVLNKMYELNYINKTQLEITRKKPLLVISQKRRERDFALFFIDYVKQILIEEYGVTKTFNGGLKVYTTVDPNLQKLAEEAIKEHLYEEDDPTAALISVEPATGYIKAMVGGEDFKKSQFNIAVQKNRQTGSTFKVFVLAAALENGISPYIAYPPNGPIVLENPGAADWEVENYGKAEFEETKMIILEGIIRSVNVVYAQLIMDVGPGEVARTAMDMGITTTLEPYPSIALGGQGVSPLDMSAAFATLANNGIYIKPVPITKILDPNDQIIYEHEPEEGIRVLREANAYRLTKILEQVIQRGTGVRANIGRPAAGKTGTTQEHWDAWFVGYTPDMSTAVWVGHPEENIRMERLRGLLVQGGTYPAMIWKSFMQEALKDIPVTDFTFPSDPTFPVTVCTMSGLPAGPNCPPDLIKMQSFRIGDEPDRMDDLFDSINPFPSFVGMRRDDAIRKLEEMGYKNIEVVQTGKAGVKKGTVFDQEPKEGEFPGFETPIKLYVSS